MFYFWESCSPKLALAARVRQETTMPIRWIAARLRMGSPKSLRPMLYDWIHPNEPRATQAIPRKATGRHLQFEPLADLFPEGELRLTAEVLRGSLNSEHRHLHRHLHDPFRSALVFRVVRVVRGSSQLRFPG